MDIDLDFSARMFALMVASTAIQLVVIRRRRANICWTRLCLLEAAIVLLGTTMALWYAQSANARELPVLLSCGGAVATVFGLLIILVGSVAGDRPSFFEAFARDVVKWQENENTSDDYAAH